ncbi:MAG: ThuA domain-containing protein [Verrucomicrobiales bacterium]
MTSIIRLFAVLSLISPVALTAEPPPVRVLVWDERQPAQKEAYGGGYLGDTIAAYLAKQPGLSVKSVALESPDQGLDAGTLDATDVIVWWGHVRHQDVTEARAAEVAARVRDGRLGLVPLHSAHWAKPFVRLMQDRAKADALAKVPEAERATAQWEFLNANPIGIGVKADAPLTPALSHRDGVWTLTLPHCVFPSWRADGAPGRMTTRLPAHPIAAGLPEKWDVLNTEMYNEPFHVPEPDAVVFEERWDKGESFRSGCAWQVGKGRVFYFRPGHETYAVYRQINCLKVIDNAVRWASPAAAAASEK